MNHHTVEVFIEMLRQKNQLTDLESDCLDTFSAFFTKPFDADAAKERILCNNVKYPDIFLAIAAMPTTVTKPFSEVTDEDLKYNLYNQLMQMAAKSI